MKPTKEAGDHPTGLERCKRTFKANKKCVKDTWWLGEFSFLWSLLDHFGSLGKSVVLLTVYYLVLATGGYVPLRED